MKNSYIIHIVLLLAILVAMSFSLSQQSKFYYAYAEKIFLKELDNKLIVRYNKNKKTDKKLISSYLELGDEFIKWEDDSTCVVVTDPSKMKNIKDKILKQGDVKTLNMMYSVNSGLEMGVTDEFIVKFKENVSQKEIEKLHKNHGVIAVKTTDIYQLLKVPNGADALEIANIYQESGLTRFSHPNFISEVELHQSIPNDPYFVNQFSLNNTGQVFTDGHFGTSDADIDAPEAWDITKGDSNIIIAVLDEGLTSNHPDLPNSRQIRLNGSNFADGDPNDPSPTADNNHGNASAGIIGATQNNNQGIAGIAPNCKIMPIRIFNTNGSGITPERLAGAIDFARQNGAHIISNSWGYGSDNSNLFPVIRDAIIVATTQGRNNLGCVVVFSAGNNFANNGPVHFPSNVDVDGVLTVGASDRYDQKSYYSPLSNPTSPNNQIVDLVAPSHRAYSSQIPNETLEAWSIDIPGTPGYNPVKNTDTDTGTLPIIGSVLPNTGTNYLSYTGRFGGTSYSCPQVAGVAALMLSVNPDLTQQEVFDILISSADKVGGYNYTNDYSNELGYGRLNALKAVEVVVSNIQLTGNNPVCNSNTFFSLSPVPNGIPVNWSVSSNLQIVSSSTAGATVKAINSTVQGNGFVTATVGTRVITKNVWIGIPSVPSSILGFCCNGKEFGSESIYEFTVRANNQGVNQFNWLVAGGTILEGQGTNTIIVKTAKVTGSNKVYFDVSARVGNSCGWSSYLWRSGYVTSGVGPAIFSVYPNPTDNEVTISVADIQAISETDATNEAISVGEVKIYDFFGSVKKVKKTNSDQKSITINVSDLQKGTYLILINRGTITESHKLIIE